MAFKFVLSMDFLVGTIIVVMTIILMHLITNIILPPRNFPRNISTIPFYVTFLPLICKLDQEQIYNKYLREKLETNGAVKIYFASRWNILVTRPQFLGQIFRDEGVFAKSGNQKKAPYSILSDYTGDNIISAHGKDWKLYRKIMSQSILFPNTAPVLVNSHKLVKLIHDQIKASSSNVLVVNDLIQRFCLGNIGDSMLGVDLLNDLTIHSKIKNIKQQIFNPFYLAFPILDCLPIPSRVKARAAVKEFRNFFCNIISKGQHLDSGDTVGSRLLEALDNNIINEKQFADNAIITLVAGHENPQLLLTSLLYMLSKNSIWQGKLQDAILEVDTESRYKECINLPILTAIIYETLRLYPPLGQIINRKTIRQVVLGGTITIPEGVYVGYNNFGTGRDVNVWGSDSNEFKPERWGDTLLDINTKFSFSKRSCTLPAFHGRKRACIGEKFALFETKIALITIVSHFKISLSEDWCDRITPAGPICPVMLKLKMEALSLNHA